MATKKSLEKDISFFVNEETPNYWKFMFFLIRNAFSTKTIILIAILIAVFQSGSQIPQLISSTYQAYQQSKSDDKQKEMEALNLTRQEKLITIQNFDAKTTSSRISQIYKELEQVKTTTDEHIKKTNTRDGKKETALSDLNSRYFMLISYLDSQFKNPIRLISIAQNPTNLNLDNFSKSSISNMLNESIYIQNNFYHGTEEYTKFMNQVNESLILK